MSTPRYRPRRSLRSELFPLAMIIALPVALYLAFPSRAIGFTPAVHEKPESAYYAVVKLGGDRERQLLAAARSAWQSDTASRRGTQADLLGLGSAAGDFRIASGLEPVSRKLTLPVAEFTDSHIPSGLSAEPPATLAPDLEQLSEPAFPKAELLKLN